MHGKTFICFKFKLDGGIYLTCELVTFDGPGRQETQLMLGIIIDARLLNYYNHIEISAKLWVTGEKTTLPVEGTC
jgi:hypothetical protein